MRLLPQLRVENLKDMTQFFFQFPVKFDAMGLTDNENPLGLLPFLSPGFSILGKRRKRALKDAAMKDPDVEPYDIAGGERYDIDCENQFFFFTII